MRIVRLLFSLILLLFTIVSFSQSLKVSENGRFIQNEDGTPFFYLGDTAWELFHRLNSEEAEHYLRDRAEKGFTVIQAVVLSEFDGLNVPNAFGEVPLFNSNPERPNAKYFEHIDSIVNKAEEFGLFVGMLPTWGDKFNRMWGKGPEVFTIENAKVYGEYLGRRYKNKPIIWILGGDRNPNDEEDLQIMEAMAQGLKTGNGGAQLITYHPQGGSNSSEWFHNKKWLDFNMFQSGHSNLDDEVCYKYNLSNASLIPIKPTLNGEPCYEDHPVNWLNDGETRWFNDSDTRKAAYWSMFGGACGHTFGNHNIWQMWEQERDPISWARTNWLKALDYPGAFQMKYMKDFFEYVEWYKLNSDQSLILNENPENEMYQLAMISSDSKLALVYTPFGLAIDIDLTRLKSKKISALWFNPRDGSTSLIGEFDNSTSFIFKPLSEGRGSDWILVIK